jgi:hypothetical protein
MVQYTLEQRVFLYDTYVKYGSAGKYRRKFRRKFRDKEFTAHKKIHNLVNKLRTTRLLIDKKQKHTHRVLTEEKVDDIEPHLNITPRKSLKYLAQERSVKV